MSFHEEQRFKQLFIWLPLIALCIFAVYQNWGEAPIMENNKMWSLLLPLLLVIFLLVLIRLKTSINQHGIQVQFFPFHLKPVVYKWEDIYTAEVLKYSPIGDYGGWGIRISLSGKGKAFSVSGTDGIKIILENGKTRMLGTQLPKDAQKAIQQFIKEKEA